MQKIEKIVILKSGYVETLEKEEDSRTVSLGDVLRTTVLLNLYSDKSKFNVTWVTDEKAFPLLEKNPFIDRLLRFDWISAEQLKKERFDVLINLEKVPGICVLADNISARIKLGFTFNPETRKAEPYDKAAEALFVSTDPEAKKQNNRLLQEILYEIIGAKWNGEGYILGYKPKTEIKWDVGFNIIGGQKWLTKSWPEESWNKLEMMLKLKGISIDRQDSRENIEKGILTNLNYYIDWINSCNILVSIDSLGLHIAIALKKKAIGLFGPTPSKEVYFYDQGKSIIPEKMQDCIPCFKGVCEKERTCMKDIPVEKVYEEVIKMLNSNQLPQHSYPLEYA